MKILMITPRLPYPPDRGGEITIFNFLKRLSQQDEITLVSFYDEQSELNFIPELKKYTKDLYLVRRKKKFSITVCIRWLLFGECYLLARHTSLEMKRIINQQLSARKFDIIQVESFLLINNISKSVNIPIVLDTHNVFSQIVLRMSNSFYNPVVRFIAKYEYRRTLKQEIEAWRRVKISVAVSPEDQNLIRQFGGPQIACEVVCPGSSFHSKISDISINQSRMIFVGSLNYHPNIDGLKFFIENILPAIKMDVPDLDFIVVGRDPSHEVIRIVSECGGKIHSNVPDVAPYLASSVVEIVPLRIGGGVRMKILEALAAGKAIVSTSVGCEGLPVTNNSNILIRDNPIEFAEAVIAVIKNQDLRMQIQNNAKCLSDKYLSWETTIEKLRGVYKKALRTNNK